MTYPARVSVSRKCSRAACPNPATLTLTYVYSDSTVVLGPLATYAEPHAYDMCDDHGKRLTAPRGWDVVRLGGEMPAPETHDDLLALANAVRGDGPRRPSATVAAPVAQAPAPGSVRETSRRGHLRVLKDVPDR